MHISFSLYSSCMHTWCQEWLTHSCSIYYFNAGSWTSSAHEQYTCSYSLSRRPCIFAGESLQVFLDSCSFIVMFTYPSVSHEQVWRQIYSYLILLLSIIDTVHMNTVCKMHSALIYICTKSCLVLGAPLVFTLKQGEAVQQVVVSTMHHCLQGYKGNPTRL